MGWIGIDGATLCLRQRSQRQMRISTACCEVSPRSTAISPRKNPCLFHDGVREKIWMDYRDAIQNQYASVVTRKSSRTGLAQ